MRQGIDLNVGDRIHYFWKADGEKCISEDKSSKARLKLESQIIVKVYRKFIEASIGMMRSEYCS